MLTATQIRTAKTAELQKLKHRIEAELEKRQEEAAQHQQSSRGREVLETSASSTGTYQWELVECGHRERCKKCKSGKKHGPYLYRYFYRGGKYTSRYIKLKDLDKHPEAPPRPTLSPR